MKLSVWSHINDENSVYIPPGTVVASESSLCIFMPAYCVYLYLAHYSAVSGCGWGYVCVLGVCVLYMNKGGKIDRKNLKID